MADDKNKIFDLDDILNLPEDEGKTYSLEETGCPYCKNEDVEELEFISDMMREVLEDSDITDLPTAVCIECYHTLNSKVTLVGKARIEEKKRLAEVNVKYQEKGQHFKAGQTFTKQKLYKDARNSYIEYLEAICFIYNLNDFALLKPTIFNEKIRLKESTMMCFVMADLIKVYDQLSLGQENIKIWFRIFKEFLPQAQKRKTLVIKLTNYSKKARNKKLIDNMTNEFLNKKGKCFIATAILGDSDIASLIILRSFRDYTLKRSYLGRQFIYFYYRLSPKLAEALKKTPLLVRASRWFIKLICKII